MTTATVDDLEAAPDESPADTMGVGRRNIAFALIAGGMLLAALDGTIVATALPTITGDLGGAAHLSWVVTAYMLTQTVATALGGKLGDIFGRKLIFLVAITVFVAASALAGASESMTWLIASRALQGLGGGALTVTATAMIADIIPLRLRGTYQGAMGAVFGVTTVIGPFLGGLLTDHVSWRAVFYVNVPIAIGILIAGWFYLPNSRRSANRPAIDGWGIAWITAATSMLVLATSWGGTEYEWTSPTIIGLFIGAVVALGLFVLAEGRAESPILPLRLFRSSVFTVSCVLSFVVGFALMGTMTYLPSFMQYCLGISATASGARTFPMVFGLLVASTAAGTVVSRTGRYRLFPIFGCAIMALGAFLLAQLDQNSGFLSMSVAMLVLGAGIGLSMQVLVLVVQNTVEYADLGVATSAVSFFRTIGSTFGAAVMGSVYVNQLDDHLPAALQQTGVPPQAISTPEGLDALPAAAQTVLRGVYSDAFQVVFMTAVPVALVGVVLALMLKQVPLRGLVAETANDVGRAFAVPDERSTTEQLESMIVSVLRSRRRTEIRDRILARDDTPDDAVVWAVVETTLHTLHWHAAPTIEEMGVRHQLPAGVLRPALSDAVREGQLTLEEDGYHTTEAGKATFSTILRAVHRALIAEIEEEYGRDLTEEEAIDVGRIAKRIATAQVGFFAAPRHRLELAGSL